MTTPQTVIENAVIEVLAHTGPCTMDEVVGLLPKHGWSEIFSAVDEMSRDGRLVLRRSSNSVYHLSLSPSCQRERTERTRPDQVRFCLGCGYLCDESEPEGGSSPWIEAGRYLKKYGLTWMALDRTDAICPACSRVQACGTPRVPPRAVATAR
jgi:hypothetical protein